MGLKPERAYEYDKFLEGKTSHYIRLVIFDNYE
jgi:hypothetical protein